MFPLIETVIAFSAIMLVLTFLVKSLTSVIKNHFDFYSRNLKHEVYSLLEGTLDMSREQLEKAITTDPALKGKLPWLSSDWKRLGEDYLSKENIIWVMRKINPLKVTYEVIEGLEGRLAVHVSNVRYMFEKRLKNITLAVGLALCLGLNINAIAIWDKMYNDQDARAKFSSPEFVEAALKKADELGGEIQNIEKEKKGVAPKETGKEKTKAEELNAKEGELAKQREAILRQVRHFQGEVSFGIGKIWTETPKKGHEACYDSHHRERCVFGVEL